METKTMENRSGDAEETPLRSLNNQVGLNNTFNDRRRGKKRISRKKFIWVIIKELYAIGVYVFDIVVDGLLMKEYVESQKWGYFGMTLAFCSLAAMSSTYLSVRHYIKCQQNIWFKAFSFFFCVLQLDPIMRRLRHIADVIFDYCGYRRSPIIQHLLRHVKTDKKVVVGMRKVESAFETAPQFLLQLTVTAPAILRMQELNFSENWTQLFKVARAVLSFAVSMYSFRFHGISFKWKWDNLYPRILMILWQMSAVLSRTLVLSYLFCLPFDSHVWLWFAFPIKTCLLIFGWSLYLDFNRENERYKQKWYLSIRSLIYSSYSMLTFYYMRKPGDMGRQLIYYTGVTVDACLIFLVWYFQFDTINYNATFCLTCVFSTLSFVLVVPNFRCYNLESFSCRVNSKKSEIEDDVDYSRRPLEVLFFPMYSSATHPRFVSAVFSTKYNILVLYEVPALCSIVKTIHNTMGDVCDHSHRHTKAAERSNLHLQLLNLDAKRAIGVEHKLRTGQIDIDLRKMRTKSLALSARANASATRTLPTDRTSTGNSQYRARSFNEQVSETGRVAELRVRASPSPSIMSGGRSSGEQRKLRPYERCDFLWGSSRDFDSDSLLLSNRFYSGRRTRKSTQTADSVLVVPLKRLVEIERQRMSAILDRVTRFFSTHSADCGNRQGKLRLVFVNEH